MSIDQYSLSQHVGPLESDCGFCTCQYLLSRQLHITVDENRCLLKLSTNYCLAVLINKPNVLHLSETSGQLSNGYISHHASWMTSCRSSQSSWVPISAFSSALLYAQPYKWPTRGPRATELCQRTSGCGDLLTFYRLGERCCIIVSRCISHTDSIRLEAVELHI